VITAIVVIVHQRLYKQEMLHTSRHCIRYDTLHSVNISYSDIRTHVVSACLFYYLYQYRISWQQHYCIRATFCMHLMNCEILAAEV
jgi:hypothetical protein